MSLSVERRKALGVALRTYGAQRMAKTQRPGPLADQAAAGPKAIDLASLMPGLGAGAFRGTKNKKGAQFL